MKENSKSGNILVVIATLVLLAVSTFASYAYFNSKFDVGDSLTLDGSVYNAPVFTAYSTDPLEMNVAAEDLTNSSAVAVKSDLGNMIVSLSSPVNDYEVSCTYDIELIWDTTDQYVTPTGTLSGSYLYEISLKANQTVTGDTTGKSYPVTTLTETNLTNFTWQGTAGTIGRSAKIISGAKVYSKTTNPTEATWNFTLNFYSLPHSQLAITGKTFGAHLSVTNVMC